MQLMLYIIGAVHGIFWVCLLEQFDFEIISRYFMRLLTTSKKKKKISIDVWHQDVCSISGKICVLARGTDKTHINVLNKDNYITVWFIVGGI